MKALAGMLLAFSLAAGIGNQADAQQCANKHASVQTTKSGVKKHGGISHSAKKSTSVIKTKSYGGYKRVNSTMMNMDNNSSDFDSTKVVPLDGGNLDKAL